LCALLSLFAAAVSLWAVAPAVYPPWASESGSAPPVRLGASRFDSALAASALPDAAALKATGVHPSDPVLVAYPRLEASEYPQLRLDLRRDDPEASLFMFWRTASRQRPIGFTRLQHPRSGIGWHTLADAPGWEGEIAMVGFASLAHRGADPLRVLGASFFPASREALEARLLEEWWAFRPWSYSNSNKYEGVGGDALLHPAAAAGLWTTLALLFFLVACRWLRPPHEVLVVMCLLTIFVPWFGLDRLWQRQLEEQVAASAAVFGGLSQSEKSAREPDAALQRYARRLRDRLPAPGDTRLFVLHDSKGHHYWRLRLQFHLLPHDIFNFGRTLERADRMRDGDHLLLLGELGEIAFDGATGVLRDDEGRVPVARVDRHRFGTLYRVEGPGRLLQGEARE
jgi:hypothetical protein